MEVTFTHPLKSGIAVEVTASYNDHGLLEWGVTTPQSVRPSLILSQIQQEEALIDRAAEERIAERERERRVV